MFKRFLMPMFNLPGGEGGGGGGEPEFSDDDLGTVLDGNEPKAEGGPVDLDPDLLAQLALAGEADAEAEAARLAQEESDRVAAAALAAEQENDKKGFIPQARLNAVLEKGRQKDEAIASLEARLAALEAGKAEPVAAVPAVDPLEELENKVVDAQIAVDTARTDYGIDSVEYRDAAKGYAKLNREMSRLEAQGTVTAETARVADLSAKEQKVETNFRTVAQKAYEAYPFLVYQGPTANAEAQDAVVSLRNDLMATGMSKDIALQKAVDTLGPIYAKVVTPAPAEDAAGKAIREARETAARVKAAAANNGQPPAPVGSKEPDGGFKFDILKTTDKEFGDLPENVLRQELGLE